MSDDGEEWVRGCLAIVFLALATGAAWLVIFVGWRWMWQNWLMP